MKIKKFFATLAMDCGRAVELLMNIGFRIRRLDTDGRPYRQKLRGGTLIAANHQGFIDPLVVSCTFWYRRVHFLAAEVVMSHKIVAPLLRGMGCIKIDRTISDIEAIGKSVAVLKEGRCLVMFPEGGIKKEVTQVKAGAALIALQAGVPILPMYSAPRKHWWQRRVAVIGEMIHPKEHLTRMIPSVEDLERISSLLLSEIDKCKKTFEGVNK